MATAQTWHQRERRYQLDRPVAERVLAELESRLPRLIYVPGAIKSLVVTTYLDTADRHYLGICTNSNGRRSLKMRVREYLTLVEEGQPLQHMERCFLERKERIEDVRLKQRVEISKRQVSAVVSSRTLHNTSTEAHALSSELATLELEPVLVSVYERRAYGNDDGLRVTFDERLAYYQPPADLYDANEALTPATLGPPVARGPSRILEIKYPANNKVPDWLDQQLAAVPTADGFSKFRSGMQALESGDGKPVRLSRPIAVVKG